MAQQRPAAVTQQDVVRNLTRAASTGERAGAVWYLVAQRWHGDWVATTTATGIDDDLGPVANDELLLEDGATLKRGLVEGQDYVLVPESVWSKLVEWYGGGPAVARPLIEVGFLKRRLVVEVYPMAVRVVERRNASGRQAALVEISKAATGRALLERVCRVWYMAPHRCQLWRLGAEGYDVVGADAVLQHCGVDEDTLLVLEERLPDGDFEPTPPYWARPRAVPGVANATAGTMRFAAGAGTATYFAPAHDSTTAAPLPGVTGLVNVGNTCFMNSSLQCLAAVRSLRDLLTDASKWKSQINTNNPLGTQGRVVTAMADLVGRMWAQDNVSHVVPRQLKKVISDWAPQFEGYRQHDAQEFVAFLLDGLHEDLNRKAAPSKKGSAAAGVAVTESERAAAAWDAHLQRNRSEIVSLFHGQLRSRLECPRCKNASVTFDAMSVLSLPLPRVHTRVVSVCFVAAAAANVAQEMDVTVQRAGTIGDLKNAVRAAVGRAAHLIVGEVYQRVLHKEYADSAEMALISPGDAVFAFEVDADPTRDDTVTCQFVFRNGRTAALSSDWPLMATFRDATKRAATVHQLAAAAVRCAAVEPVPLMTPRVTTKSGKMCGAACGNAECRGCAVDDTNAWTKSASEGASKQLRVNVALDADGDATWVLAMSRKERVATSAPASVDKASVTLDSCIRRFLEPETLSAHDAWYCPTCRDHVQAQKKIDLWKLPPVLVVHLKRFAQLSMRHREKLEDMVVYPTLGLDLGEFVAEPGLGTVYDLVGVSNHMGGLSGGHYIAHTRHAETGGWWQYNDQHCTRVESADTGGIVARSAYLLFYVLRAAHK